MSDLNRIVIRADEFSFAPIDFLDVTKTSGLSRVIFRRDLVENIEVGEEFLTVHYKQASK